MKRAPVQQLLDERVAKIGGVRNTVVLSEDGLPDYLTGVNQDAAEIRAAMASALAMTARRLTEEENGGRVRQIFIEADEGSSVIVAVGKHSHLVAAIEPEADMGLIAYELTLLAQQLTSVLEADPRPSTSTNTR